MKHLMVRADDLGYSEAVNYGIVKTVTDGIIRNVGFMVNMPYSIHGWNLIQDEVEHKALCIGQHTNICVGRPLTDPGLIPSITQPNGEFKASMDYRSAEADFVALDEVILEIEAQYRRFVEITGRQPQYFEGHAVASDNFFKGMEIVAARHGLKYLGMSMDGPVLFNGQKMYMHMDSGRPDYDPFASLQNMYGQAHEDGYDMLVLHPGYLDDYILTHSSLTIPRTKEVAMCCDPKTYRWLHEHKIRLYTYDEVQPDENS